MTKKLLLILIIFKAFEMHAECRKDTVNYYSFGADSTQKYIMSRQINNFNAGNQIQSEIIQLWDNALWNNYSMVEYTYSGSKNTVIIEKEWKNNGQIWANTDKTLYTYDNDGNKTEMVYQNWDVNSNDWLNKIKVLYTYDMNRNNLTTTWLQWNYNVWENRDKTAGLFTSNLLTELQHYEWTKDSAKWLNKNKNEYTYNNNKQLAEDLYSGKNISNMWVYRTKTVYSYNTINLLAEETTQNWNGTNWINATQYSISYNISAQKTSTFYKFWNSTNNIWDNDSKTTYDYFGGDLIASDEYFTWDNVAKKYSTHRRSEYLCANLTAIHSFQNKQHVSIAPNPCINSNVISVTVENTSPYTLSDMTGKLIAEGIFNSGENSLVLNERLSDGVYFLNINQANYKLIYHPL